MVPIAKGDFIISRITVIIIVILRRDQQSSTTMKAILRATTISVASAINNLTLKASYINTVCYIIVSKSGQCVPYLVVLKSSMQDLKCMPI
jgi:hypothetical protein